MTQYYDHIEKSVTNGVHIIWAVDVANNLKHPLQAECVVSTSSPNAGPHILTIQSGANDFQRREAFQTRLEADEERKKLVKELGEVDSLNKSIYRPA